VRRGRGRRPVRSHPADGGPPGRGRCVRSLLLCLILALFIFPGGGCPSANGLGGLHCDTGRGFGYWLAVLAVLAGLGLAVMRMRETTGTTASS
jgi:hypothetical protein